MGKRLDINITSYWLAPWVSECKRQSCSHWKVLDCVYYCSGVAQPAQLLCMRWLCAVCGRRIASALGKSLWPHKCVQRSAFTHRFASLNFPYLNFHNLLIEYNSEIDVVRRWFARGFLIRWKCGVREKRMGDGRHVADVCGQYQSGNIQVPSICCITQNYWVKTHSIAFARLYVCDVRLRGVGTTITLKSTWVRRRSAFAYRANLLIGESLLLQYSAIAGQQLNYEWVGTKSVMSGVEPWTIDTKMELYNIVMVRRQRSTVGIINKICWN